MTNVIKIRRISGALFLSILLVQFFMPPKSHVLNNRGLNYMCINLLKYQKLSVFTLFVDHNYFKVTP